MKIRQTEKEEKKKKGSGRAGEIGLNKATHPKTGEVDYIRATDTGFPPNPDPDQPRILQSIPTSYWPGSIPYLPAL
ncbi:hypothetical protein K0M31_012828 [Melipona bicolor]|uniref:Uncharacterized protein n=1 Tax=Melipona bicolor TaxID=60889 RepID=A0AA40KH49_9HYME|nr:hypothetical protein K0M31_012828 [Melipona bicolor]